MCFRHREGVETGVRARGAELIRLSRCVDMLRSSGMHKIVRLTTLKDSTYQTPWGCPEVAMRKPAVVLWLSNSRLGRWRTCSMRTPSCFYIEGGLKMTAVGAECLTVLNQASLCPSPVHAIIFGGAYEARGAASVPRRVHVGCISWTRRDRHGCHIVTSRERFAFGLIADLLVLSSSISRTSSHHGGPHRAIVRLSE